MLSIEPGIASFWVDKLIKNCVSVRLMTCRKYGHFETHLFAFTETLNGVWPHIDAGLDAGWLLIGWLIHSFTTLALGVAAVVRS